MFYEPRNNDHGLPFNPLKACVVPRPIGWISTVDAGGAVNLAPFSFFNMLSYNPPYVLFSSGMHSDSAHKDTVLNIEQTGEFVYNMATWEQREAMNTSALIVERGIDELAAAGLEPLPSNLVRPNAATTGRSTFRAAPPGRITRSSWARSSASTSTKTR